MSEIDRQKIFCDLERCSKQYKGNEEMESECLKCTYHRMGVDCVLELISDSFSLVKELLEENESLAKTVNEASELIRKLRSKVKKSKSDVAREIFAEIENILDPIIQLNYAISVQHEEPIERAKAISVEQALRSFRDYLAELKKKYTESEKEK